MLVVPVQSVPNQTIQVQLANQACQLVIRQFAYGLFMDVYVSGEIVIGGVICEDRNRIVRDFYLGLIGDFTWVDTQGVADPLYTGIGSRWLLVYLEAADIGQDLNAFSTPPDVDITFLVGEGPTPPTFLIAES